MIKPISKSLYTAASSPYPSFPIQAGPFHMSPTPLGSFRLSPNLLSPFPLREYGASQTRAASQSTPPSCARTVRLRRIRGEVDIGGLGYG
jgi:hypothetical protein